MPSQDQRIAQLDVGGRAVSWVEVGTGPPLIIGGWWSSHLAMDWRNARFRRFVNRLAARHRVIRYDRPGLGLSDPTGAPPATLQEEADVLAGVAGALGLERFAVFGGSSGCAAAAVCAASMPARVSGLVLYGGYARGADIASDDARAAMLDIVRGHWGLGSRVLTDVFMPGATAAERAEFARFQRSFGTPEQAASQLAQVYRLDCRDRLPALVGVPTLVVHRRGDRAIPSALGEDLAARIPNAVLVLLSGIDHFPWLGDSAAVTDAALTHLAGQDPHRAVAAPASQRDLTTREIEVLRLVARGLTDAEIASQLVLSPHTVHRHVSNIRLKLGVPTRAAAAVWAAHHADL